MNSHMLSLYSRIIIVVTIFSPHNIVITWDNEFSYVKPYLPYIQDALRHTIKSEPTRNGLDQIGMLDSYPKPIKSKCVQTQKQIDETT